MTVPCDILGIECINLLCVCVRMYVMYVTICKLLVLAAWQHKPSRFFLYTARDIEHSHESNLISRILTNTVSLVSIIRIYKGPTGCAYLYSNTTRMIAIIFKVLFKHANVNMYNIYPVHTYINYD